MIEPREHKRLAQPKRQVAIKNTLLIADCLDCHTTITVGTDDHTPEEAEKIEAMKRRIIEEREL